MVSFIEARLSELFSSMKGKRIAVVGDLMLDRYFWGNVSRISPEAPVPVIDLETEQDRLGGAANVAKNIKALGGEPFLIGVVGGDNSGKQLFELIRSNNFSTDGVIVDPSRPTTVKTRVIAHGQHVVRIDRELKSDISTAIQHTIVEVLVRNLNSIDGIILEDYNKGVIAGTLIKQVVALASQHRKIITADPKFNNFFEYKNVTVFKPNRKEAEEVLGMRLKSQEEIERAGKTLREQLNSQNILLTLGERGMALFEQNGSITHVPTRARHVLDVSGAGDTVISTLTMALAGKATMKEAVTLANVAGGIVCGYVGIVPIDPQELTNEILHNTNHQDQ